MEKIERRLRREVQAMTGREVITGANGGRWRACWCTWMPRPMNKLDDLGNEARVESSLLQTCRILHLGNRPYGQRLAGVTACRTRFRSEPMAVEALRSQRIAYFLKSWFSLLSMN
jgi:hypothetical protein